MTKTTLELAPGDRIVRGFNLQPPVVTIDRVIPLDQRSIVGNHPLHAVWFAETMNGSPIGNTSNDISTWEVLT